MQTVIKKLIIEKTVNKLISKSCKSKLKQQCHSKDQAKAHHNVAKLTFPCPVSLQVLRPFMSNVLGSIVIVDESDITALDLKRNTVQ